MRKQLQKLCNRLANFFLILSMKLDGRSTKEIESMFIYLSRVSEPVTGEVEEVGNDTNKDEISNEL
jgi:hypothetical protein